MSMEVLVLKDCLENCLEKRPNRSFSKPKVKMWQYKYT